MQPIAHPPENGAGLPRMVGWSAGLHLVVLTALVVMDLIRPRPTIFRDVIRVDLVAPQAPTPEPAPPAPPPKPKLPPLKENPLWDKLGKVAPPAPPKSDKAALAEIWSKVSKPPPKPKPRKEPEDLKKWWTEEMRQAREAPAPATQEPVKIPERQRLADAWKQINAALPEAARIAEAETPGASQGELADWWNRQMAMAMAPEQTRQASASALAPGEYTELIRSRLYSRWSPPDVFRDGRSVTVVLAFDLLPDGHVRSVKVVQSSGSAFYDQAAIRAIFLADPFPPFPEDLKDPDLEIRMTFSLDRSRLG